MVTVNRLINPVSVRFQTKSQKVTECWKGLLWVISFSHGISFARFLSMFKYLDVSGV